MFEMLGAFDYSMISSIAKYVLWGTIAIGVIFFLICLSFVVKRLKYNKQMKHNKKEKEKLIKAYDQKIQQLEQMNAKKEV